MEVKTGFVGLGIMGRPMALNLRNAGHALWVYGRRPETMKPLIEAGAIACAAPKAVAAHAEVVFVCVPATSDVEQVILGADGLIHGARPGTVIVDMSTISPAATRGLAEELRKRDVDLLDAPVSGGEIGAVNGTLSIMVGGKPEVFARVKPYLEILGKNIVHVGDHGAGQVAKACNQIVAGLTIEAVGEALTFARRNGVDAAKVRDALMGGFAASKILEVHGKRMLENNFTPGFKVKLHRKDLHIVLQDARTLGLALPGAALVAQQLETLVDAGDGELDSSAMVKVVGRAPAAKR